MNSWSTEEFQGQESILYDTVMGGHLPLYICQTLYSHVLCWAQSLSRAQLFETPWILPGDLPGKNTGVGCHALLQGIFPTQGSNPGVPHCRRILYCLNHQGSPRIPTREAQEFPPGKPQEYWSGQPIPSPGELSDPGIKPGSPALQADSLPAELPTKPNISQDFS